MKSLFSEAFCTWEVKTLSSCFFLPDPYIVLLCRYLFINCGATYFSTTEIKVKFLMIKIKLYYWLSCEKCFRT
jgi:hypothetical protein